MVSNEEGEFTFLLENVKPRPDSIYISYMGYETKGIVFKENEAITIPLVPKLYELKKPRSLLGSKVHSLLGPRILGPTLLDS